MGCSTSKIEDSQTYSKVQPGPAPSSEGIKNEELPAENESPRSTKPQPAVAARPEPDDFGVISPREVKKDPNFESKIALLSQEEKQMEEVVEEDVLDAPQPWARFMALWVCCTLASGILPGQALFAKQFADAGVFGSMCGKDESTCKDQYLALTGIFGVGQSLAYGFSAPIGLFYDRWGAMATGTVGAATCALGLICVTLSCFGASAGLDSTTQWVFICGVFICDFGSMLNSFSFMGLIWHFPGSQTVVIALINATYQASALLPLLLQFGMDYSGKPLSNFMTGWCVVVCFTIYGCYALIPRQKEFYDQAKKVLGMPLPKPPTDLKVCEMLSKAAHVLRQSKEEHIASGIALALGFALPGYYSSMTAPYGEALFGHKEDGERLAELNVLCTSVVGLLLAPFTGSIGDKFGLEVIIFLFCAIMFVATVTMGLPYWPAQTICGCSLALFISLFTIFISRYLLLYSPPNRYGAVQGVYTFAVILVATPWSLGGVAATAILPAGVNSYRIPMIVFGVTGVLGLTAYAFYFQRHLPPEVPPLLPEDEAELAKGFGCNTLEEVMEITHLDRHELLNTLSSTNPEVVRALMKSIDTEKLMEVMNRRSVDDIAEMMETAEDEEEEVEEPTGEPTTPVAPTSPRSSASANEGPIREKGRRLARQVAAGDKEAVKYYLLTEPIDDMWKTTLDMEEWQTPAEQKQMDKDFNKLIPGKEFAALLRQRPELKKFVQQVIKREMNRKIAALTGRKKK